MEVTGVTPNCTICYEDVDPRDCLKSIWVPCCRQSACFHRECMQKLALSAGYCFKCPFCNNCKVFRGAMLNFGIYIPNRLPSWEQDPAAFQDDLYRHNHCDAEGCACPYGPSHAMVGTKWELVLCRYCGSQGMHVKCGNLIDLQWECVDCRLTVQHAREESHAAGNKIPSKQKQQRFKGSGGLQSKKRRKNSVRNSLSHPRPCSSQSFLMPKSEPTTPISVIKVSDDVIEIFDDDDDGSSDYGNSSKYLHFSVDGSSQPSTLGTDRGSLLMSENVQGGCACHAKVPTLSQQMDGQVRCGWYCRLTFICF